MNLGDKTQIRRHVKNQLAALDAKSRASASFTLRQAVSQLPGWDQAHTVAAFMPLPDEPDLSPLSWLPDRRVLLPVVQGHELSFGEVRDEEDLVRGAFGILEPAPHRTAVTTIADANIILVPGIAFTREGFRLGRGLGFYDRALAVLPRSVLRIGVCFAPQIMDELPVEAHDQKVDLVLSAPV